MSREGTDSYVPGHGDPTYSVSHYDLEITYKVEGNHLHGRARLDVEVLEDTDGLSLDLHHLNVDRVTLGGKRVKWRARRDKVQIAPGDSFSAGTRLTVEIRYAGTPRQVRTKLLGSAGWEELSDGALVAGQPHGAPSWFPCNDRPDDKASYRVSVTVPAGYHALANGALVEESHHSSRTTFAYEQSEPMATYLATVHVGRYRRLELDGPVPTWALVPPGLADQMPSAFARQGEMLSAFIDAFGPYPFPSYGVVVTEDDLEIPLESQGFSTFGENFLRDDWDAIRLVAHELAHQWFGNSLTLQAWRDIWLHEGFACYAEWLWSEAAGGEPAELHARRHHERLAGEPQDFLLADPGAATMFDDRLYKRGALALHAIRLMLAEEEFFGLLRDWVGEHRHGTVTTESFVNSVIARAADPEAAEVLCRSWIREPALPELPPGG